MVVPRLSFHFGGRLMKGVPSAADGGRGGGGVLRTHRPLRSLDEGCELGHGAWLKVGKRVSKDQRR